MQIRTPQPPLGAFLDSIWSLEIPAGGSISHSELIVPDGSSQLLLHFRKPFREVAQDTVVSQAPATICGLHWKPATVEALPGCDTIALVFRPGGLKALLGIPAGELAGLQLSLGELSLPWLRDLPAKVSQYQDFTARASFLERFFCSRAGACCRYSLELTRAITGKLQAAPAGTSLAKLAAGFNISLRSLERFFADHVGIGPKLFLRISRFQRTLRSLQSGKAPDLAALAQECGYFDQSHLQNEFREFSGLTPGQMLAAGCGLQEAS